MASRNYRLTTRRLFRCRGFARSGIREVALTAIAHVVVRQAPWERLLKVGTIRVKTLDGTPPVLLEGVSKPAQVALMIRQRVELSRGVTADTRP